MKEYEKLNTEHEVSEKDPFTERRYEQFYKFLNKEAKHVLDMGCNTGRGGRVLKGLHPQFVISGLDIVQERLNRLPKDIYESNIHGSCTEIPVGDGTYDAVLAGEFVEHLYPSDLQKTLHEVFRILKVGGQIMLTTPNPGDIKKKYRNESVLGGPHLSQHHPDALKLQMRMTGFSNVKIYGSGQVSSYLGYRFPALCIYGSYLAVGRKY